MTVKFINTNPTANSMLSWLQKCCNDNLKQGANIKSVFLCEYTRGIEGKKTVQQRATKKVMARMENILDKIIVDENFNFDEAVECFEKGSILVKGKVDSKRKSYFCKGLKYIEAQKNSPAIESTELLQVYSLSKPVIDKGYVQEQVNRGKKPSKAKKTIRIDKISLRDRLQKKYPERSEKEIQFIIDHELERLETEFNSTFEFLEKNRRDITIDSIKVIYYRLLGWEYLHNESLTIEDISLNFIIPIVDTKVGRCKTPEEKYIKEGEKREEAMEKTDLRLEWLELFFEDYGITSVGTADKYIDSFIAMSKFYYKGITNKRRYSNYEDIEFICALRVLRHRCAETMVRRKVKPIMLNYSEVIQVMKSLKADFDHQFYESISTAKNNKQYIQKTEKNNIQKAKSLQKFLMLMLVTVYPPERQRTLRELTFAKTLKFGTVDELGFFKELNPFEYQNNGGMYFIFLNPEDHKNGNEYYQDALFNREFEDGTCVYDYLNLWWGTYRQYLVKGDTNTFFVRQNKGDQHNCSSVWGMFTSFFYRKARVKVNPHQLRHIFATYINECEDAGENVKASAAYRMRHSVTMFNTIYNQQSQASKSKSINSFFWTLDKEEKISVFSTIIKKRKQVSLSSAV
ncbi:hypothetical protein [Geminocystis sp. GBBB08]|uniref:hypothetical protein n=1 Tax=Geminocystis sp. GBBB08 TaxID=2604140 RepID=UPI0027E27086|nr:hypothetical protein [Geminocystis sp. GBBB08]MBL1210584.1 hypothetical protein [Geminocystis sp. GBBB08]